jgi:Tfp pilus assembly protein PilF
MDFLEQQRLMNAAQALADAGNPHGAIGKLKELLAHTPSDADALAFLAALEMDNNRLDDAGETIRRALEHGSNSDNVHRVHGHYLARKKRKKESQKAFEEAVRLGPDYWKNHLYLAMSLEANEDRRRAEETYLHALNLEPDEPEILNAYADFLIDLGRRDEAKQLIERAAKVAHDDEDTLLARARVALHEGRIDEAMDLTLWTLRHDANNLRAVHLLVQIKMRRNPILGIWWRWAAFTGQMTTGMRWGLVIGLYIVWQILYRAFISKMPGFISTPIVLAWVGFCILTWVGPSILSMMVKRELKKVSIKPTF